MKKNLSLILSFVATLGFIFIPSASGFSLNGVDPTRYQQLEAAFSQPNGQITCDQATVISKDRFNDNYCDCADGQDEPGTSACPTALFYCTNKGFKPKSIASNYVDDGICDCCDGSDEKQNKCQNTCQEMAREIVQKLQEELVLQRKGLELQKLKQPEIDQKFTNFETRKSEIEVRLSQIRQETENLGKQIAQIEQDIAAKKRDVINEDEEEEEDEDAKDIPHDPMSDDEALLFEDSSEASALLQAAIENIRNMDLFLGLTHIFQFFKTTILGKNDATGAKTELENEERTLQDELSKIEFSLKTNFGPNRKFFPLYGNCWSVSQEQYTYELCPFDKVSQQHTRLGNFDNSLWEEQSENGFNVMKFTHGERCWQADDRIADVSFSCGLTEELSNPQEPHRCVYTLDFISPTACSEARLAFVEEELKRYH